MGGLILFIRLVPKNNKSHDTRDHIRTVPNKIKLSSNDRKKHNISLRIANVTVAREYKRMTAVTHH